MKVGVLTGGGDCPGLNAVIRAIGWKAIDYYGYEVIGVIDGWAGLLKGEVKPLDKEAVSGILHLGGTILGTSRTNPFKSEDGPSKVIDNFRKLELEALIAIGGDDTLGAANKLYDMGLPIVGVPKTIDNDLSCTDYTFGFDTAINTATEAIGRLHSTAEAHHRVIVVEVMGRHAGWVALMSGLAGGADYILIPEFEPDIDDMCRVIKKRLDRNKLFSIVVVSEGTKLEGDKLVLQDVELDDYGHVRLGGIAKVIAQEIERRTGVETRTVVLGHVQRGGPPTAFDRILATRYGIAAIDLVAKGEFGKMVSLQGNKIVSVPLEEAVAETKAVDLEMYEIARVFFG